MIMRIFIEELTLQHVMLLSTCVLIKLNGKGKKKTVKTLPTKKSPKTYIDIN